MSLSTPSPPRLNKMVLPDALGCRFIVRHRREFLKTYSESLFQGGSGHIFNFFFFNHPELRKPV
jgi:hypothetical protein